MVHPDFPAYRGRMEYVCLDCGARYPGDSLLYACPRCGGVFLLENLDFDRLKERDGAAWRELFDARASTRDTALRGIFRYYELLAPLLEQEDIVYLGEGLTPIVEAAPALRDRVGLPFAYKNDGQNPSASFKDRGMACAFSYLKWLCRRHEWDEVLTVCASTGDTSAAAALYAAYVGAPLKSVVLLPHGKVTPQQLSQPLGSGATVLELPGVFDDCMKVVEHLAENYRVALGIITSLPRVFGVQSEHADPVWRYYAAPKETRHWQPVTVTPSVAQAAMIGNPVSFPRVRRLAERFVEAGGETAFQVVQVTEQQIMDAMIQANRHGHIACTQGGECLAGLLNAHALGLIGGDEHAVLDATAHSLKFAGFQDMYFNDAFPPEYGVTPDKSLANRPELLLPESARQGRDMAEFARLGAEAVVERLGLKRK